MDIWFLNHGYCDISFFTAGNINNHSWRWGWIWAVRLNFDDCGLSEGTSINFRDYGTLWHLNCHFNRYFRNTLRICCPLIALTSVETNSRFAIIVSIQPRTTNNWDIIIKPRFHYDNIIRIIYDINYWLLNIITIDILRIPLITFIKTKMTFGL